MDKNLEKLGRRSKEMESVRAIERRRLAIERTSARASKKRIERTCIARKRRRSIIVRSIAARWRSSAPRREAQTSRSPILEVCNF
jgi:hypothetical protein